MGTQFSSRLTPSDRKSIREGLTQARTEVLGDAGLDPNLKLTKSQLTRVGDATMRVVLRVAQKRDFFGELESSELFVIVLEWLKKLHGDAKFNGFQGIILEYELESPENLRNPIPRLMRELKLLTEVPETRKAEKFRVAIANAAKVVLAYVITLREPRNGSTDDTLAQVFGRKLASLDIKTVVTLYIKAFIGEVVKMMISSSDPGLESSFTQTALQLTESSAARIANRIITRTVKEGKLLQSSGIQAIVIEELRVTVGSLAVAEYNDDIVSFYEFRLDVDPGGLTGNFLNSFRKDLASALQVPSKDIVFLGFKPGSLYFLIAVTRFAVTIPENIRETLSQYRLRSYSPWRDLPDILTFISHSHKDAGTAHEIYEFLHSEGFNPWLDRESLVPGEQWLPAIRRAIQCATAFVYCLSRHSIRPRKVLLLEAEEAEKKAQGLPEDAIFVVPVRLDDCKYPPRFEKYQGLDWDNGKGNKKLSKALAQGLSRRKKNKI